MQLFSMFLSNCECFWPFIQDIGPTTPPVLLTLRLVALYKRKRWVSWFLYTFLVVSYAVNAIFLLISLSQYGGWCHSSLLYDVC